MLGAVPVPAVPLHNHGVGSCLSEAARMQTYPSQFLLLPLFNAPPSPAARHIPVQRTTPPTSSLLAPPPCPRPPSAQTHARDYSTHTQPKNVTGVKALALHAPTGPLLFSMSTPSTWQYAAQDDARWPSSRAAYDQQWRDRAGGVEKHRGEGGGARGGGHRRRRRWRQVLREKHCRWDVSRPFEKH